MEGGLSPAQTAILEIVKGHAGKGGRIQRKALLHHVRSAGMRLSDRHMREEISALRESGYPVLGTRDGGYYWPIDPGDVHEFIKREITSRTMHLHRQEAALRRNLHVHFGQMDAGLK